MSENTDTILEVNEENTNDGNKVLPHDLKIKEVLKENIEFVTDFAKKTGDYSSLSATDIKVLALAYQIDKEMEMEDDLMMDLTTVNELSSHTSNSENKDAEIKDNANENEEFTMSKETEPPKHPTSDCSKIIAEGAKKGANWSATKNELSDAVHLDEQNLIGDNFLKSLDQKSDLIIARLIKKMVLSDGHDVHNFKPDKYTDDEDSDSDFSDSDNDTDGDDPDYSSEKLGDQKQEIHIVEFEDGAVGEGT